EGGSYGIWTVHDTVAPARAQSLRRAPVGSATAPLGGRTRLQQGLGGRAAHGPLETPPRVRSPRRPGTPADQPDTHWPWRVPPPVPSPRRARQPGGHARPPRPG